MLSAGLIKIPRRSTAPKDKEPPPEGKAADLSLLDIIYYITQM